MSELVLMLADGAQPTALGLGSTQWVSLAMLLLIGIFVWKKVPGIVAGLLDSRIAAIKASLDEAARLRADAEALLADYQTQMAGAADEAAAIKRRAEAEAADLVAKAEADSTALIGRRQALAEQRIAAAEAAAVAEVQAAAAAAAAAASTRMIAAKHDGSADRALVDAAIAGLA